MINHVPNLVFHTEEDASQVYVHRLLPVGQWHLHQGTALAHDSSIVEGTVQSAELRQREVYRALDLLLDRGICMNKPCAAASIANGRGNRVAAAIVQIGYHYTSSASGQQHRGCLTDAAASAGHDDDSTRQIQPAEWLNSHMTLQ